MNNKLIAGIIGLTVCVIVASSVLAPVIKDSSSSHTTFSNVEEALGFVDHITDTDSYSIVWDMNTPEIMTVNGVSVTPYAGSIVMALDSFNIRYGFDTGSGYYVQSIGSNSDLLFKTNWPVTSTNLISFDFADGSLTVKVNGVVQRTYDYSGGFVLADKSDFVMKSPTQKAYMLDDSEIYANGRTNVNGLTRAIQITGTIQDVDISISPYAAMSAKNIEIHAKKLVSHEAYQFESITFDMVNDDDSQTTACTYNYLVVPAEISAEKTYYLDYSASMIVAVIPVMVLVACMVYAVTLIRNRD